MRIEVISVHDTPDGGCRMVVEMDEDTAIQFAKIGLLTSLRTAAEQVIAEHREDDEG